MSRGLRLWAAVSLALSHSGSNSTMRTGRHFRGKRRRATSVLRLSGPPRSAALLH